MFACFSLVSTLLAYGLLSSSVWAAADSQKIAGTLANTDKNRANFEILSGLSQLDLRQYSDCNPMQVTESLHQPEASDEDLHSGPPQKLGDDLLNVLFYAISDPLIRPALASDCRRSGQIGQCRFELNFTNEDNPFSRVYFLEFKASKTSADSETASTSLVRPEDVLSFQCATIP